MILYKNLGKALLKKFKISIIKATEMVILKPKIQVNKPLTENKQTAENVNKQTENVPFLPTLTCNKT